MVRTLYLLLFLVLLSQQVAAQSLAFSRPRVLFPGAMSDKSIATARLQQTCLAAWKDTGRLGQINVGTIAPSEGHTAVTGKVSRPVRAITGAAPALQVINDRLYLLWIGADSSIYYMMGQEEADFEQAEIHLLATRKPAKFTLGLHTAFVAQTLMMTTHAPRSGRLLLVSCEADSAGLLSIAVVSRIKNARSDEYPVITPLSNGKSVRISWADYRNKELFFADYSPEGKAWQLPQSLSGLYTSKNALVAHGLVPGFLTCIGQGSRKSSSLWYSLLKEDETQLSVTGLPDYFTSAAIVSTVSLDSSRFALVYMGADRQLYGSYATLYDPAGWIGDRLLPGREHYSLKDIVIPGSHDAGMSVLSGVGGQGAAVINECNTLTQVMGIGQQLNAGIRMFDLRIDEYEGALFAKHAPADCMEDAIGGGYGEKLSVILDAVKQFLENHEKEFVILSFCHFCDRNVPLQQQAEQIASLLGKDKIFYPGNRKAKDITLQELAGKVMVTFEDHAFPESGIDSNSMTDRISGACMNYRRAYAATNVPDKLFLAQKNFFTALKGAVQPNDLVRLDWQLTEASQEAIFICNDFESERSSLLLDGAILLANTIKKNKSITTLGMEGNQYLPGKVMEWMTEGTINRENKPNILYVDVAGNWITDFCMMLNEMDLYSK